MASESRVFPCNTCNLKFESSELQRSHMRQPWHIHNLRRRVAELPALSEKEYLTQATTGQVPTIRLDNSDSDSDKQPKKRPSPEPQSSSDPIPGETTDAEPSKTVPSTQCLFCNTISPTLDANVEHMSSTHGLFIPSQDQLSDMESFLGYLATLVFEYHQCLYCGLERGTADGVQTHMRDKGHCMINLTPESELLEFWELSGSESEGEDEGAELPQRTKGEAVRLSETEWRLPSGAVINSRSDATLLRAKPGLAQTRAKGPQQRSKRDELKAITASAEEDPQAAGEDDGQSKPTRGGGNDRRVAIRGEMGLVGVSEDQRRALQVTEKKMKRREAIAKSAYRHAMEMQPRKTIYYKTENPVYQAG